MCVEPGATSRSSEPTGTMYLEENCLGDIILGFRDGFPIYEET